MPASDVAWALSQKSQSELIPFRGDNIGHRDKTPSPLKKNVRGEK